MKPDNIKGFSECTILQKSFANKIIKICNDNQIGYTLSLYEGNSCKYRELIFTFDKSDIYIVNLYINDINYLYSNKIILTNRRLLTEALDFVVADFWYEDIKDIQLVKFIR